METLESALDFFFKGIGIKHPKDKIKKCIVTKSTSFDIVSNKSSTLQSICPTASSLSLDSITFCYSLFLVWVNSAELEKAKKEGRPSLSNNITSNSPGTISKTGALSLNPLPTTPGQGQPTNESTKRIVVVTNLTNGKQYEKEMVYFNKATLVNACNVSVFVCFQF